MPRNNKHRRALSKRAFLYTPMFVARRLASRKRHQVDSMLRFHPSELPLGVQLGGDDALLLRSFLVDALPCALALDDSFVTSAERHHCRDYFDHSREGQAARAVLLHLSPIPI